MSRYLVIKTVDILGDEEFLVIPQPSYEEFRELRNDDTPYWFDNPDSWSGADFLNPEIYANVDVIRVEF